MDNTPISNNISSFEDGSEYDAPCRKVLSYKSILARILKGCVPEFENLEPDYIESHCIEGEPEVAQVAVNPDEGLITGANTIDASQTEGTVMYDIRFDAYTPEKIKLIINVEAQGQSRPGYPLVKRGLYYCARMLSAQYGREFAHSEYGKLKKVYSIFICLNPPTEEQNTITRYRIVKEDVVGKRIEDESNYDLLDVVMVCLGDPDKCEGILRMLSILLLKSMTAAEKKDILQNEFDIKMQKDMEGDVDRMSNIGAGLIEKGRTEEREELLAKMRIAGISEEMIQKVKEAKTPKAND